MGAVDQASPSYTGMAGMRTDERAVRLLFVEQSPDYATLVRETLQASQYGHFEVCCADALDAAVDALAPTDYDAVLVDLTRAPGDSPDSAIDAVSRLATRLPVIVLTGCDEESPPAAAARGSEGSNVRERIAGSRLPAAILRAVRRYRRLGQRAASEPIVHRDPLRALAKRFAAASLG